MLPGFSLLSGSQIDLNSPKRRHQLRAEHLRQQRAARLAVAVLAGNRAAVAHDEVRGVVDERAVLANARRRSAGRS